MPMCAAAIATSLSTGPKQEDLLWLFIRNVTAAGVLASRPHGEPTGDNFRLEESEAPTPDPGQVLLRTVYLSLDPYMRGRMSDAPSYSPPGCHRRRDGRWNGESR